MDIKELIPVYNKLPEYIKERMLVNNGRIKYQANKKVIVVMGCVADGNISDKILKSCRFLYRNKHKVIDNN